jgi:hypothetical protein
MLTEQYNHHVCKSNVGESNKLTDRHYFGSFTLYAEFTMPKYSYDDTPENAQPKPACWGLREDLKECLLKSDCVKKVKRQGYGSF